MRPHLSLLIVVIALAASGAAIAAGTSTSSGGGGVSSGGGGGGHGGGGGSGGGHGGGVGGHAVSGGGSANLGRGSFSQVAGNHAADHAIAVRTADKTHPGNPEHHHHRFWKDAYPSQLTNVFSPCATLRLDRSEDLALGPYFLCGNATKAPTNPRTGRPAG
jgi:hypothetical protein